MCCGNLTTSCHLSYSNSDLKETLRLAKCHGVCLKKNPWSKAFWWTFDLQKRCGERHDEQSGWCHGSGPTVLAGKAQGRDQLKGPVGCARWCRKRGRLCSAVFLLATMARLLKNQRWSMLCCTVTEWSRPEEDKETRHQERGQHGMFRTLQSNGCCFLTTQFDIYWSLCLELQLIFKLLLSPLWFKQS